MRPVKIEFYDHPFDCPICGKHMVYTSMHAIPAGYIRLGLMGKY